MFTLHLSKAISICKLWLMYTRILFSLYKTSIQNPRFHFKASATVFISVSGVNGKPVYRISFRLGRNDEIRKEYLRTGY